MVAETHRQIRPHTAMKPRRRKKKQDSISATASPPPATKKEPPSVSLDASWCCAPTHRRATVNGNYPQENHRHLHPETTKRTSEAHEIPALGRQSSENQMYQQLETNKPTLEMDETASLSRQSSASDRPHSPFRSWVSPGRISPVMDASSSSSYPSSYTKFNSALSAGLLNPMSPPSRLSPTLFEMMSNEPESQARNPNQPPPSSSNTVRRPPTTSMTPQDKHLLMQEKVNEILGNLSPGNRFNDSGSSDVKLTLSSKDGFSVSVCVHRHILSANSRFYAAKLADRLSAKQQRAAPYLVEISDCEDVEVYLETLHLMYCDDLKRRLMREDVSKVLEILKVSAAIVFDAGILACLEYLEAAPWAEDEEEKVANLLSQLQLDSTSEAGEVLKRVSMETPMSSESEIVVRLLDVVLQGKDDKARKEMKGLVSKMLRENSHQNTNGSNLLDISRDSLYAACNSCLDLLLYNFSKAAQLGFLDKSNQHERSTVVGEISRQTDNLNWVVEILIDRRIAEDFARIWAIQAELAKLHTRVPTMYRYEVSRLTARLCVAIGKGQILTPKEVRSLLLQTWLEPLYDDFGWMRRGCKSMDQNVVEEGLGQTILTLPLSQQQTILLNWFDRFSNAGDECPNIQKAFEVWWRRAFWRRSNEPDRQRQLQITTMRVYENGS